MDPREIVADIYRQIVVLQNNGSKPTRVTMDYRSFRVLSWYKSFLGSTESGTQDYLSPESYSIFGLSIFAGNSSGKILVE
ncbi:MAG: hypothetical protein GW949_05840 [Spirochaetales bacterium]|nr:hypothetical protein [Spirochaetales bacterium]